MTNFARGRVVASGVALWLAASTAVYAQSGAANNPLRGNQQPARNQPAHGGQPRVAAQPSGSVDVNPRLPAAAGQPNAGSGQRPGGVLPNGQPAQPVQLQIQPPFVALSPQEQAELNKLLADWEAQSDKIKTFKCSFVRTIYDPAWTNKNGKQPIAEDKGEIKYAAPDKGLFHAKETASFVFNDKTGSYDRVPGKEGEWWTCTGSSVFEVNHQEKLVKEYPIAPELRGKAITDGPLPFVFGAKADQLKQRYFIRVITPPNLINEHVWLEVFPKLRKDAQNFSRVELILTKKDLLPFALQIYEPVAKTNDDARTVITLLDRSVNSPWAKVEDLFRDFSKPNPFGYKHLVVQPQAPGPAQPPPAGQAQNPAATQPPQRQALVPQSNVR